MPRFPRFGGNEEDLGGAGGKTAPISPKPAAPAGGDAPGGLVLGSGPMPSQGPQQAPGQADAQDQIQGTGMAAQAAGDVSGGAGVQAQGVGTGYVNLASILSANAGSADKMANSLSQQARQKNQQAPAGASENWDAEQYDNGLQSQSGLQGILQNQYKGQAYTEGGSALDAFLAGSAGHDQFKQALEAYKPLSTVLSTPSSPTAKPQGAGTTPDFDVRGKPTKKRFGKIGQEPDWTP